jgi:thiamine biosynthesis lipoprotein
MQDGRRYHHILDPISGYPSENAISVTVIAETALLADAYSTALFLLEPKDAIELAEQNNVEAIIYFIITDEIEKLETQGMRNYYERQN